MFSEEKLAEIRQREVDKINAHHNDVALIKHTAQVKYNIAHNNKNTNPRITWEIVE